MTYDETTPPDIALTDITAPDIAPTDIAPVVPLPRRLSAMTLAELFALDIKPRGMVLDPIIPEKGLAMLYATRGTGKTHVALGIAIACRVYPTCAT